RRRPAPRASRVRSRAWYNATMPRPTPARAGRGRVAAGSEPREAAGGGRQASATPATVPHSSAPHLAVTLLATACVVYAIAFRMSTPDVWQHLLVGKALWQLRHVPGEHLWSWPTFGTPEVLPSWGFAALLWPFWLAGGDGGLQLWRWLTTLLAFGLG